MAYVRLNEMYGMRTIEIKTNPDNPRLIKDDKFKKLVQSIKDFPEMMELRPIIIDENNIIQGGNMRYKALIELGYKDIPDNWVKQRKDLTTEQWKEFVIKDNVGFGEWDWDVLANEWDSEELEEWGLDLPDLNKVIKKKEELKDFARSHVLISYHPDQHMQIQRILIQLNDIENIEIETASN
jgi:ParB-like chromosome segregation protein Spo0J